MIELEISDSKAARPRRRKAAKGNPTTISTRVRTLNGERLKVNDKMGNPHRDRNRRGVARRRYRQGALRRRRLPELCRQQAETALRHVASVYAYDHPEDESDAAGAITLRANVEEVSKPCAASSRCVSRPPAWEVDDARLTHLAYFSRDRPGDAAPPAGGGRHRRAQEDRRGRSPWSTWP